MPDVLHQCVLLNDKDGHDKVWAAMVVALPSPPHAQPMAQYVSIWGKRNGPYQHKWQPVETRGAAFGRYSNASYNKLAAGYRSIAIGDSAGLSQFRADVLAARFEPEQSKTATPEEHNENTCDYCIDRSAGDETNLCVCGHSRRRRHLFSAESTHKCVETGCGCQAYVRATPAPKPADEPFCVACDAQRNTWTLNERNSARDAECARCGLWANDHRKEHPHGYLPSDCSGLVLPPEAIPLRLLPKLNTNIQDAQEIEKREPAAWLPDLPCSASVCGHWTNSHATAGETTATGGKRICLVAGCSCEQWRYVCAECGYLSIRTWSHQPTCNFGAQHRKRDKPEPIARTVQLRQPRRISHLLTDID